MSNQAVMRLPVNHQLPPWMSSSETYFGSRSVYLQNDCFSRYAPIQSVLYFMQCEG